VPVKMIWKRDKAINYNGNRTTIFRLSNSYPSRYIYSAIPTHKLSYIIVQFLLIPLSMFVITFSSFVLDSTIKIVMSC